MIQWILHEVDIALMIYLLFAYIKQVSYIKLHYKFYKEDF